MNILDNCVVIWRISGLGECLMLFILFVITFFNFVNSAYAFDIKFNWFSQQADQLVLSAWFGDVAITVIASLFAVIMAAFILFRYKHMSEYDQQFESISMQSAIVCSLANVFMAITLMFTL